MPEERKVYRRPARTAAPAPQAGQAAPRPDAPPPPKKKKRPGAKRRRSRLVLGLCLLCLLVVVIVSVVLVRCSAEEGGPAEADFGTPAAAWQKNDLGYYFNTSGRAMPAAVLKGMDVSKFQGEIDWEKAKAAGIDFAIIRCGFGGEWDGQEETGRRMTPSGGATPTNAPGWASRSARTFIPTPRRWRRPAARPTTSRGCWA